MFVHVKEVWPTWTFSCRQMEKPTKQLCQTFRRCGCFSAWRTGGLGCFAHLHVLGHVVVENFGQLYWFSFFQWRRKPPLKSYIFNSCPNYPDDMNRRNLPIICYHCFCSFQNWSSQIVPTSFMPWTARWILTLSCGRKTPSTGKWNWEAAPAWLFPGPTEGAAGTTETAKLPFEGGSAQHPRGGLEGPLQRLPMWRWTCQYSALESTELTLAINRHTFS